MLRGTEDPLSTLRPGHSERMEEEKSKTAPLKPKGQHLKSSRRIESASGARNSREMDLRRSLVLNTT
jgi:hypothetical protein